MLRTNLLRTNLLRTAVQAAAAAAGPAASAGVDSPWSRDLRKPALQARPLDGAALLPHVGRYGSATVLRARVHGLDF